MGENQTEIFGQNDYRYRMVENWAKPPLWWDLVSCSDVAVDSEDRVFLLTRGVHPVIVFDRDGKFLSSWGEGLFSEMPHGIFISPDDTVYITDVHRHVVRIFSLSGELEKTLGTLDRAGYTYPGSPSNMPTGVVLAPNGYLYISDGYGNRRVHKFDSGGERVHFWGDFGTEPGRFAVVHNVAADTRSRIYVCDRENNRVQIFDENGEFLDQWTDLRMPGDLCIREDIIYLVEQALKDGKPRLSVFDTDGNLLSCWEKGEGLEPFASPHGIWVDSRGDIYVSEISDPLMNPVPGLRKFERI